VINFWASWCAACREEHPNLLAAWERYRDQGVVLVGIDFQDQRQAAIDFMREMGGDWPVVDDAGGRTALDYGVCRCLHPPDRPLLPHPDPARGRAHPILLRPLLPGHRRIVGLFRQAHRERSPRGHRIAHLGAGDIRRLHAGWHGSTGSGSGHGGRESEHGVRVLHPR